MYWMVQYITWQCILFPTRQILGSSKLKHFEDDNFKFDENWWEFSKRVENTVGIGEIARNEQFLLFPRCFQKDTYCKHVRARACLGKGYASLLQVHGLCTSSSQKLHLGRK